MVGRGSRGKERESSKVLKGYFRSLDGDKKLRV